MTFKLPCEQFVPPTPNERATVCFSIEHARVRHAPRDASDVNFICSLIFCWKSFGTKESKYISPKALTKERFKPSSKYCIYLVCGLKLKPKFKALLSSLERDLVNPLNTTLQRTIRNNTSINYDRKEFCKNTFKRLDVIKANKRTQSTRERISAMYSTISKN